MRDAAGRANRVMVFAYEVTDEVRARRELDDARARAEQASRAKDEFLAMLGHELRNPLAPITTALRLLHLKLGDAGARERAIIERQVAHLVRLVDDLLDVSRIASGKLQLRRRRIDMAEVVGKAIEMASPLFEEREHHLETLVVPGLYVDGDEVRLAQVVANLLTNAARYTPRHGHVDVRAQADGDGVAVAVRDDGIGIRPDLLPQVFDLFVQGRRGQEGQGGLGLGLTLVRSLARLHGGSVSVDSEGEGRGSEFVLRIPRASRETHPEALAASGAAATQAISRRILVVDDNRDAAHMLGEVLQMAGHQVHLAFDGPSAITAAGSLGPDLVLLDLGLPAMDGYELAGHLRRLPRGGDLRLIAVTGYGQDSDRARTREAGFALHLVKPIDAVTLPGQIESLFEPRPS